jgi:subtilase family serine protease
MRRQAFSTYALLLAGILAGSTLSAQVSPAGGSLMEVQALDRITAPVNGQQTIVLSGNRHPLATPQHDRGAVTPAFRMERMLLTLRPSAAQQQDLDALVAAQNDPSSSYYHHWLTPAAYAQHYGVSGNDLRQIVNWLQSHGLRIEERSGRSIVFSGTAAQVEAAFHTPIHIYENGGKLYYANAADPAIPAALGAVVDGVVSLHNFRTQPMHTTLRIAEDGIHSLAPADFAVLYNLLPLYASGIDGTGQSIAIAGRSSLDVRDVRLFRQSYGLAAKDPEIIVNGADSSVAGPDEEAEALLDVEWAGAVARNATIKFVVSPSTAATDGVLLSARYIVNRNLAPVLSVGFGLCEAALGAAGNSFLNSLWQQAAAQGMTVVVSSGNSGAAGCDDAASAKAVGGAAVNGLSSPAYSTSVGGTELNDAADPGRYWSSANISGTQASILGYIPENVWNESAESGLWSSGGGTSSIYTQPSWQAVGGVSGNGKRTLPDVALTAASHDGYLIYLNRSAFVTGGTGAASASFAALMALVVQAAGARQGSTNPVLYALANGQQLPEGTAIFHDISAGDNTVPGVTGYVAGARYDLATGLGSVDGAQLVNHWNDVNWDRTAGPAGSATDAGGADAMADAGAASALPSPEADAPAADDPSTPAPLLYYLDVESGPETGGPVICVYGENFGANQNTSTLFVGDEPVVTYQVWSDPGAPYGAGHYAQACGWISQQAPPGAAPVRLTTPAGASNILVLRTGHGAFGNTP